MALIVKSRRDVFFSSRRRHTRCGRDWSSDVCSSDLFVGTTADLTRVHQGWGTVSVRNLFTRAQAGSFRLPVLVNETDLLTVGQRRTYQRSEEHTSELQS